MRRDGSRWPRVADTPVLKRYRDVPRKPGFSGIVLRGSDTSDIVRFMDARLIQQFFFHQASLASALHADKAKGSH
jgi:hypothetical protein